MHKKKEKRKEKKNAPQLAAALVVRFSCSLNIVWCLNRVLIFFFFFFLQPPICDISEADCFVKGSCVSCESLQFDVAATHQHYLIHSAHGHWSMRECV